MNKNPNPLNMGNDEALSEMIALSHKKITSLSDELKGLAIRNNNIKIYKSANDFSIMDITASLNYHKLNNRNENEYKGKIILSITDRKKGSYIKFFLDKAKSKVLMSSIMNHTFNNKMFAGGFSDFGGTGHQDPNKIKARTLRISLTERNQYKFTIHEGKGKVDAKNGRFKMVGEPIKTVERYIPYEEALEMAHEVYDYIRDQEMKALINGKPLYTLTDYMDASNNHIESVQLKSEFKLMNENYIVQIDPWKGVPINSISNQELKYILKKTKGIEDSAALDLHEQTMLEIRKRMNKPGGM